MDFGAFQLLTRLESNMSVLSDRVAAVVNYLLSEKQRLLDEAAAAAVGVAEAKDALAAALANDAADAAAIEVAKSEAAAAKELADASVIAADEARAKATELQAVVDADVAEDQIITGVLDQVQLPA